MSLLKIRERTFSNDGDRYYIIAEAGVNHENNIDTALRLVDLAKEGGAYAIKFQTYKAAKLASRHSPAYWDTSKEPTRSQYELFQKYDSFGIKEYERLYSHALDVGIEFMTTAFDLDSLQEIDPLVAVHKVASADLTNLPLLRKIAITGKPVLMSTGASSFVEVARAIEDLKTHGCRELALLHCVLNYPTAYDKAHIARITSLQKMFGNEAVIGYSDHTLPHNGCFPVVAAYILGARIIEKHFTHDKTLPGNDHYHAMDVADLRLLRERLEEVRCLMGHSTEKAFLQDQSMAIQHARRSIVMAGPLAKGSVIGEGHITVKRPGAGISPLFWDEVIGRRLLRDIGEDELLTWDAIDQPGATII